MNKLILALTATTAIIAVSPIQAQYSDRGYNGSNEISQRIDRLESRLQAGISSGAIDRDESRSIYRQIRDLNRLERQYKIDGLSESERQDLQQRIRDTRDQLRAADGARLAEGSDDEYYDRYASRNASSEYREVGQLCGIRSGLSGFFGSLFGSEECLTVGDRAPANLAAVPQQYRDQFRDSSRYHHRYLNGNVVQIDSRSGEITRIFDVYQSASR